MKQELYQKHCKVCGESFETVYATKLYCSQKCVNRHEKRIEMVPVKCSICKKTVLRFGKLSRLKTCGSLDCVKEYKSILRNSINNQYRMQNKRFPCHIKHHAARMERWQKQLDAAQLKDKARSERRELSICLKALRAESKKLSLFLNSFNHSHYTYKDCLCCGNIIYPACNENGKIKKYCSRACSNKMEWEKRRRKEPLLLLMRSTLRSVIYRRKQGSYTAQSRRLILRLGYTESKFIKHIESTWQTGMTWSNYGQWHIDHIIPAKMFHPLTDDNVIRSFALSNLSARWATTKIARRNGSLDIGNINKGARFILCA